jgi:NAD(P)-dependent dehydrogenase (short-subunit alcohol dehydrogenase family)
MAKRKKLMQHPGEATILTGGGRGIGRAISRRLACLTPLVLVGRTASDLESARLEVEAAGGQAVCCPGDVADPQTAEKAVRQTHKQGWTVRNLVCNAGLGKTGPTATFDRELWKRIFDVNVHGCFYFIQACLPEMIQRGHGVICLMSSISGVKGYKYDAAYTASKHAVVGLARALAAEVGKHGIVVVPLCPSFVESEMTTRTIQALMQRRSVSEAEARRVVEETSPQRRILPAEEVAEMVALVCSGLVPSLAGNPLLLSGGA